MRGKEALIAASALDSGGCNPSLVTLWPNFSTADIIRILIFLKPYIPAFQGLHLLIGSSRAQPGSFL